MVKMDDMQTVVFMGEETWLSEIFARLYTAQTNLVT